MNLYKFHIYPDTLYVETNASLGEFEDAINEIREGNEKNLEEVLASQFFKVEVYPNPPIGKTITATFIF